jgi:phage baseplate assembly protein V
MERMIARAIAPISRRLRLLTARAVVRLVNDGLREQGVQLQLLAGEVGDAERYQHYGFSSVPHPGAEAIVLCIGGSREHLVTIADGDRRYRVMSQAPGEVAIYTDEGDNMRWRRGRLTEINTQTLRINATTLCEINAPTVQINADTGCNIDAPLTAATGALQAGQDITDRAALSGGGTMNGMRSVYNGHRHNETGTVTNVPNQQM